MLPFIFWWTKPTYQAFAKKAAKLLKMEAKKGEELKLFKLNGAVIVDEKIDVGGGGI